MLSCFAFWRNFQLSSTGFVPSVHVVWFFGWDASSWVSSDCWCHMQRDVQSWRRWTNVDCSTLTTPVCRTNKDYCYLTLQCSSWNLWNQFQVRARSTWSPQLNPTPTAVDPDRNSVDHSSWSRSIWFSTMVGVSFNRCEVISITATLVNVGIAIAVFVWFDVVWMGWNWMVVRRKCGCVCEARANENSSKIHKNGKNPYPM